MRNHNLILCLLFAVLLMLVFAGCNNEPAGSQDDTEQTTGTETVITSTTDAQDETENSTELFSKDADDLEIMTAPLSDSNSQKNTEVKATTPAPAETKATTSAETPEPTRIELPFVPAN